MPGDRRSTFVKLPRNEARSKTSMNFHSN